MLGGLEHIATPREILIYLRWHSRSFWAYLQLIVNIHLNITSYV